MPEPNVILQTLDQLREKLTTALNSRLSSLVLFGDFVRPQAFVPGQSKIELLMVLESVSTAVLDLAVEPIEWAKGRIPLSVMTLTKDDLRGSCDVFPIRFVDMREHHRLLAGRDVLADLVIADDHLRLRCEQELKNLMIRMRRTYLQGSRDPRALSAAMANSIGLVLRLLSMALTLKIGMAPDEPDGILSATEEEFGFSTDALRTVWANRTADAGLSEELFDAYMACVQDAAAATDAMEICGSDENSIEG